MNVTAVTPNLNYLCFFCFFATEIYREAII